MANNSYYVINNDAMNSIMSLQDFREDSLINYLTDNNYIIERPIYDRPIIDPEALRTIENISNIDDDDYQSNYERHFSQINDIIRNIIENEPNVLREPGLGLGDDVGSGLGDDVGSGVGVDVDVGLGSGVEWVEEIVEGVEEDIIPPMCIPTREPLNIETIAAPLGDCSICYRPMLLIDLTITRCGHIFHASCLCESTANYSPTCPHCRVQLVRL